jgi:hypothetical protein
MAYFIFAKDSDNINGTLSRIAENNFDLDNLNIEKSVYKIIEVSQENFDLVKFNKKNPLKYNGNEIIYEDVNYHFKQKSSLNDYIEIFKKGIKLFLNLNKNSLVFNRWNDYYNQLNSLNIDNFTYPLNTSLEQYFKDQEQISLNPLQLP